MVAANDDQERQIGDGERRNKFVEKDNGVRTAKSSQQQICGDRESFEEVSVNCDEDGELYEDENSYGGSSDVKDGLNPEFDFSSLTINNIGDLRGGVAEFLPEPPDGGYGWVIVFAAFFSNLIIDGISNSFGAFISIYQNYFNASKATVSFIGSFLIGSYLLIGPVAGGLVNKYGARRIVLIGSIISTLSFFASITSSNVYAFMFLYGVLGGMGYGLIFLPAIVYVSYYFESKRSIATGIAVAGSGVGTIIIPQLCVFLNSRLDWRITICILAVFNGTCGIVGLLFRSLELPIVKEDVEKRQLREASELPATDFIIGTPNSSSKKNSRGLLFPLNLNMDSAAEVVPSRPDVELSTKLKPSSNESDQREDSAIAPMRPLSPINENPLITRLKNDSSYTQAERAYSLSTRTRKLTVTSAGNEMTSTQDLKNRLLISNQLSRISVRSYAQSMNRLGQNIPLKAAQSLVSMNSIHPKEFARPMNRRDIFYMGSIRNLPEFADEGSNYRSYRESQICVPTAVASQAICNVSQAGDIADIQSRISGSRISRMTGGIGPEEEELMEYYDDSKFKWLSISVRNAVSEMVDLQLLKEPLMILLCCSNLFGMLGFYVPFVFSIDMAIEKGIEPEKATFLLSLIGITNTFGRIAFGWIADRGWVLPLTINNASLIACGLLTLICPFLNSFLTLSIYASLFGFMISAYVCLTSIVLTDLLGLERLTNSFGLLVVSRGIASLLGTPIAGLVYDLSNSYSASFIYSGVLILLAGLISCLIPRFHRQRRDKLAYEDETKERQGETQSGKLSVLTERSEENLTEYQRTIQSLRQQQRLLSDYEEERWKHLNISKQHITVEESDEGLEEESEQEWEHMEADRVE